MSAFVKAVFGDLFQASPKSVLKKVNRLEERMRSLDDQALSALTPEFKKRLADGESLEHLMPEAFAAVREASRRVLNMRHYDVQIIGGVTLARGQIAEMRTGEGKTLVAPLPAYLHALSGKGVHVVTVNDYLAARDAEWMGQVYRFMGLSVGCIQEQMGDSQLDESSARKAAYACDITYGTNSEMVFDDLRDNLAGSAEEIVHRGFHFALVDEVDLLLIDEAQTPLIISGKGEEDSGIFKRVDLIIRQLQEGSDYQTQPRSHTATLTDDGLLKVEEKLAVGSLSHPDNLLWFHAVHKSLLAHAAYRLDVDYIVNTGRVFLVDEHTGRVSEDKRFSDGLHQALEAKERVQVRSEDMTLAKTSYQYFFRRYPLLAGMSGTAWSERDEFLKVYRLKVKRIPTNMPMVRKDYRRAVFRNLKDKHDVLLSEIEQNSEDGRPTLVGSVSVYESEQISRLLKRNKIKHHVLNAKNHADEASIISQAGRKGAVTISTNMAGRGTDILLGGSPEMMASEKADPGTSKYERELERCKAVCEEERKHVVEAGGLFVIGTGEHESVRIDNQLRGRSGRQGDPGASMFLVSIEDHIYKKFGSETYIPELMEHLQDHPAGEPVEDKFVFDTLKNLREKIEVENQAVRVEVLKYDAVIVERREGIWTMRRELLDSPNLEEWHEKVRALVFDLMRRLIEEHSRSGNSSKSSKDAESLRKMFHDILVSIYGREVAPPEDGWPLEEEAAVDYLCDCYRDRYGTVHDEQLMEWERYTFLGTIDKLWTQFLTDVERIEEGIGLRGYGNLDPLVEFRREVGLVYMELLRDISLRALQLWLQVDPKAVKEAAPVESDRSKLVADKKVKSKKSSRLPKVRTGGGRRKTKR